MRLRYLSAVLVGCTLIVGSSGCGQSEVTAPGELKWEGGGPVADATVTFIRPDDKPGKSFSAKTGADGTFEISAFPGEYAVMVSKSSGVAFDPGEGTNLDPKVLMQKALDKKGVQKGVSKDPMLRPKGRPSHPSEIPELYGQGSQSPLRATVAAGQKIELQIKKNP
jgi:hypothetical protein